MGGVGSPLADAVSGSRATAAPLSSFVQVIKMWPLFEWHLALFGERSVGCASEQPWWQLSLLASGLQGAWANRNGLNRDTARTRTMRRTHHHLHSQRKEEPASNLPPQTLRRSCPETPVNSGACLLMPSLGVSDSFHTCELTAFSRLYRHRSHYTLVQAVRILEDFGMRNKEKKKQAFTACLVL